MHVLLLALKEIEDSNALPYFFVAEQQGQGFAGLASTVRFLRGRSVNASRRNTSRSTRAGAGAREQECEQWHKQQQQQPQEHEQHVEIVRTCSWAAP